MLPMPHLIQDKTMRSSSTATPAILRVCLDGLVAYPGHPQQILFVQPPTDQLHRNGTVCHALWRIYAFVSKCLHLMPQQPQHTILPYRRLKLAATFVLWLRILDLEHLRDRNGRRAVI